MPNRNQFLRAWLYAMSRLELTLRADHGRARNAMIKQAAKEYDKQHYIPAFVFSAHQIRLKGIIQDHYRRTIPVFSKMALAQVKSRRISRKDAQAIYEGLVSEWITKEATRKSKLISDTDRNDVIEAISNGMTKGLGVSEIAKEIRSVTRLTGFRAATVARTETHAAATFGSIESARQAERELGVTLMKEWLPTNDERTRPAHAAMAGVAVPTDDDFIVGGEEMDRPGDPSASPDNVVNCRCGILHYEQ